LVQVVQQDASHVDALTTLAQLEAKAKRPAQSADWWNQALQLRPRRLDWIAQRGKQQLAAGNLAGAIDDLSFVLQAWPDSVHLKRARGLAYAQRQQWGLASQDLRAWTPQKPDDQEAWAVLAHSYVQLGDTQAAYKAYTRLNHLNPDDLEVRAGRGHLAYSMGQYRAAIADYNEVLQAKPDDQRCRLSRGYALLELKKFSYAQADLERYLSFQPEHTEALFLLGYCIYQQEEREKGCVHMQRAQERGYTQQQALYNKLCGEMGPQIPVQDE